MSRLRGKSALVVAFSTCPSPRLRGKESRVLLHRFTARAFVLPVALVAIALSGCMVSTRVRAPPAPEVVVFGPAVAIGPSRHFHNEGCGHASRWHGGRRVFYVGDHWEYVDGGNLYVYRTIRSRPAATVVVHEERRERGHPSTSSGRAGRGRGHGRGHDRDDDDDDDRDDGQRGSVREDDRQVPRYAPSHQ